MSDELLGCASSRRHSPTPVPGLAGAGDDFGPQAEADHRIANHLALLSGYVHLKSADVAAWPEEPTRQSVRLLLAGIDARVAAVSRLHRFLAIQGRQASADLKDHLHEVCASFTGGLVGDTRLIEDIAAGCTVRPDQVLPLTLIVTEVVTNAVKHAHADHRAGAITVRCRKVGAGGVRVEVIDDGAGLPPGFDPDTDGGLGFRLVRALGNQLGALMTFESTRDGLHFRLTLPPPKPKERSPAAG